VTCAEHRPQHAADRDKSVDEHDHLHGHTEHDHHTGLVGRLRHGLSEVFGGHSHDTANQVDDALEADAAGRRALLVSLAGLGVTAGLQLIVVALSGSVALLGDAVHNVADALTALPLFVAFALARRPPSRRFTYGYGRAEDLAGVIIVVTIAASAAFSAYAAVDRLLHPHPVSYLPAVAAAALVGFAGNETVARYRIVIGRRIGSAALVADGLHARTDGFTSLAVLVGAGGVALGYAWADPVVGLLITVAILGVLRSAAGQVLARLLDAVDPALVGAAEQALMSTPGVQAVTALRLRWLGHTLRAEADLEVDPQLSLAEAHDVTHHAENHLLTQVRRLSAATLHASPADTHPTAASPARATAPT
jgi:cation diffusion facilitator family transporter